MSNTNQPPNILLIMCDQLCASVLEAYGGHADAPHIGRLCERGMVFTSAYCQTPLCSPSRASIITGQYPHRHGLVSNVMRLDYPVIGGPLSEEGISNLDVTTEGLLSVNGYQAMHVGKWHISGEDLDCYRRMYREHQEYGAEMRGRFAEIARGPEESYLDWYGWALPVTVAEEFKECLASLPPRQGNDFNSKIGDYYRKFGRLDLPLQDVYDYRIGSKCVEAISAAHEPFMLTCSFNMPHDPNVVPSPYYESVDMARIVADASLPCHGEYARELSKKIPSLAGDAFLKEFLRIYHGAVKLVDDQVGRIMDALGEKGILDNTCVIFTADHGDMAGGHGMFWKSTSAFYEEVARVPLVISAPGCNKGTYSDPVELVDLMPTILSLCGVAAPEHIDGESLAPVLHGGASAKDVAVSERLSFGPGNLRHPHTRDEDEHFMLRDRQYKYVLHRNSRRDVRMLFDLLNDPREYHDLSGQPEYRDIVSRMHERLRSRLIKSGYDLAP